MLWSIDWKNRARSGCTQVEADSEPQARMKAEAFIESKYYWQGPCTITRCVPATNQGTKTMQPDEPTQPAEKYAFVRCWHPRAPLQVSIPIPTAAPPNTPSKSE